MLCCPHILWTEVRLSHICLAVMAYAIWTNCAAFRFPEISNFITSSAVAHLSKAWGFFRGDDSPITVTPNFINTKHQGHLPLPCDPVCIVKQLRHFPAAKCSEKAALHVWGRRRFVHLLFCGQNICIYICIGILIHQHRHQHLFNIFLWWHRDRARQQIYFIDIWIEYLPRMSKQGS